MIEIFRVSLSEDQLRAMPTEERNLLLLASHAVNQLSVLRKISHLLAELRVRQRHRKHPQRRTVADDFEVPIRRIGRGLGNRQAADQPKADRQGLHRSYRGERQSGLRGAEKTLRRIEPFAQAMRRPRLERGDVRSNRPGVIHCAHGGAQKHAENGSRANPHRAEPRCNQAASRLREEAGGCGVRHAMRVGDRLAGDLAVVNVQSRAQMDIVLQRLPPALVGEREREREGRIVER